MIAQKIGMVSIKFNKEINLDFSKFNIIQSALVNSSTRQILFPPDPLAIVGKSTDYVGAVWIDKNITQRNGIRLSFKTTILSDLNCYANVCYPEGFAFIFTSNPYNKGNQGIGQNRGGLGYEGLSNSIALEFDFVQSLNRNDNKVPHFSIHSNLIGPINATSPKNCTICNIKLPNIYVI